MLVVPTSPAPRAHRPEDAGLSYPPRRLAAVTHPGSLHPDRAVGSLRNTAERQALQWCEVHQVIDQQEPVHLRGRCRWCWDWNRLYSTDPPEELLRRLAAGEAPTRALIARYAYPVRKKALVQKRRERIPDRGVDDPDGLFCRGCQRRVPREMMGGRECSECATARSRRTQGVREEDCRLFPRPGQGCEICGVTERPLVLDHDHDSGVARGFLCSKCNAGIGCLGDSEAMLGRAALYLRRTHTDPLGTRRPSAESA